MLLKAGPLEFRAIKTRKDWRDVSLSIVTGRGTPQRRETGLRFGMKLQHAAAAVAEFKRGIEEGRAEATKKAKPSATASA